MIAFKNFTLRRGERLLLSNVDVALHDGQRVGVIGRNGCGKSSLFAVIQGELEPDRGDVDVPLRLRIASVAQETPSLPDPALDVVLSGDTEVHAIIRAEAAAMAIEDWDAVARAPTTGRYQWLRRHGRAGRLLHGLGFTADTHDMPVSVFSGGWRVRLNLARALMMPSDLLLLDEPTNHLDLDAVMWLEQWLLKYPGMLMMISHDREFLDGLCTHTLHLNDSKAALYRRLHQFRAPAFRALAPTADRLRKGASRTRAFAGLHRSIQSFRGACQTGAVARQTPGQIGWYRSHPRRARSGIGFSEPSRLPFS